MTFNEWFMIVDPDVDCSLHDMVWEGDYTTKTRDIVKLIEKAFEVGYNACRDDWGGLEYDDPANLFTQGRK